jgi:hypothetical protein
MKGASMTLTIKELQAIIIDREEWAADAEAKDLHGSAKEYRLTAALARELIELRDKEQAND